MFLIKKFVLYYQVFGMTGIYYFVVSILLKKEKTVAVFPLPPLEVRAEGEKSSRHSPAWTIVNAGPKGYDRLAMKERRGSAGGFWELLSPRFFLGVAVFKCLLDTQERDFLLRKIRRLMFVS